MKFPVHFAISTAIDLHQGQTYGDDELPMFVHLADVARKVAEFGGNDEMIAAGYLHDIIEDTECRKRDLRDIGFNERIISMVDLCTDPEEGNRASKKQFVNARFVANGTDEARIVKAADRWCNQWYSITTNNMKKMGRYYREFPEFQYSVINTITATPSRITVGNALAEQYEIMSRRLA